MKTVQIRNKKIGVGYPCYVISEIGNNHDANLQKAKQLIKASHEAGADAVKFQTFKALDIVNPNVPANAYPGWDVSDRFDRWYKFVETIEMPYEWYDELIRYTRKLKMAFISTPASFEAADFLAKKRIDAFKIASMDLNNTPFLKYVDQFKLPVILSTGMATLKEIVDAVKVFKKSPLILLHCVSNYPLNPKDANLLNIPMLQKRFGVPTGFSNHALGYDLDIVAVGLGAQVIEKHFTLNRNTKSVAEHHFSMQPEEMKEMVTKIRLTEQSLGNFNRILTRTEQKNRKLFRRSITVARDMKEGEALTRSDLLFIRPATGLTPNDLLKVLGKRLKKSIKAYDLLTQSLFK